VGEEIALHGADRRCHIAVAVAHIKQSRVVEQQIVRSIKANRGVTCVDSLLKVNAIIATVPLWLQSAGQCAYYALCRDDAQQTVARVGHNDVVVGVNREIRRVEEAWLIRPTVVMNRIGILSWFVLAVSQCHCSVHTLVHGHFFDVVITTVGDNDSAGMVEGHAHGELKASQGQFWLAICNLHGGDLGLRGGEFHLDTPDAMVHGVGHEDHTFAVHDHAFGIVQERLLTDSIAVPRKAVANDGLHRAAQQVHPAQCMVGIIAQIKTLVALVNHHGSRGHESAIPALSIAKAAIRCASGQHCCRLAVRRNREDGTPGADKLGVVAVLHHTMNRAIHPFEQYN